jgi:predicted secreted protein
MAILNGTVYVVKLGTDGAEVQFADQTEGSLSMNMETRDITTKGSSGYRELLGGLRSASMTFSGLVDSTLTSTGDLAFLMDQVTGHDTAANARTSTHVLFGFDASVSGDSDSLFEGDAFVTSIEVSAGTEDNVTVSATLEFTGAITYADDTVA